MTFSALLPIAAAGINLHAVFAIGAGMLRSPISTELRRSARRCTLSVAGLAALAFVVFLLALRAEPVVTGTLEPSQKAVLLGKAISEAMNCVAFVVVAGALPLGAALWLRWKAPRAR